jgi:hypothetical protein
VLRFLPLSLVVMALVTFLSSCQEQEETWLVLIYVLESGQYKDPGTGTVYDLQWSSEKTCWVLTHNGLIWYYDGTNPQAPGKRFKRYTGGEGGVVLPDETRGIFLHILGVTDYFESDSNQASAQIEAFKDFISSDDDLTYDSGVAEIFKAVFDLTNVDDYDDFVAQCETGASEMANLTVPAICSSFHTNALSLLGDPWFVLNPYYEWGTSNYFIYMQSGNTLDISAALSGQEMFDITLTKDGNGEITVSGTVLGENVSTAQAAHPVLVYQPFIDKANEWGYEKGDDPGDPPE